MTVAEWTEASDDDLIERWLEITRALPQLEHGSVGAYNRTFDRRTAIGSELLRRDPDRHHFRGLLQNPDPVVRYAAAFAFRDSEPQLFRDTMGELSTLSHPVARQAKSALEMPPLPPPRFALSDEEETPLPIRAPAPPLAVETVRERLAALSPDSASALVALLRPAIAIHVTTDAADDFGSRFGGMPVAPTGWEWPVGDSEPMIFIGQIACADLAALPEAGGLPRAGMLSFFGDYDTIEGCIFTGAGGAVDYWPEIGALAPVTPMSSHFA